MQGQIFFLNKWYQLIGFSQNTRSAVDNEITSIPSDIGLLTNLEVFDLRELYITVVLCLVGSNL